MRSKPRCRKYISQTSDWQLFRDGPTLYIKLSFLLNSCWITTLSGPWLKKWGLLPGSFSIAARSIYQAHIFLSQQRLLNLLTQTFKCSLCESNTRKASYYKLIFGVGIWQKEIATLKLNRKKEINLYAVMYRCKRGIPETFLILTGHSWYLHVHLQQGNEEYIV